MITTKIKTEKALMIALLAVLLACSSYAAGLSITEIEARVDYDEAYTYSIEKRDRIDYASVSPTNNSRINVDLYPGSNLTFTLRIENSFPSTGQDIKGVFATVTIEEIDDGSDLEDESADFELEPGDDYRADVKFPIPLDVDSGTYNTVIVVEGEGKNDTFHRTELRLKLEVKRQSHDIRITRTSLAPSIVQCDRKIKLSADIMNLGSNPENQAALEFKSEGLGINSADKGIFLESSDEASVEAKMHTKTLNAEIPKSIRAGTYPISVNLYWRDIVLFDKKTLELRIRGCDSTGKDATGTEDEEPVQIITDSGNIPEQTANFSIDTASTKGKPIFKINSPTFMFVVLGAFVVFVLAIVTIFGLSRKTKGKV